MWHRRQMLGRGEWARRVRVEERTAEDVRDEGPLVEGEREGEGVAASKEHELEAATQHVRPHDRDESVDRECLARAL
jgi:hypothetical protein